MYKIFHKNIRSRAEDLKEIISEILKTLDSIVMTFNNEIRFDCRVILNELLSNAIKHGNKNKSEKNIEVIAALSQNKKVFFIIKDCGNGYDFHSIKETMPVDAEKKDGTEGLCENGRGIIIVKSLSDNVRVNKKGNQIIVLKNLD